MLSILSPSAPLAPYVTGYWLVEDWSGEHAGQPIRTSPQAGAVLSFNFGRPNLTEAGTPVPSVSLLGLQPCARTWRSDAQTRFVMVMLNLRGLARLFPGIGSLIAGQLADLADLEGSLTCRAAHADVTRRWSPAEVRSSIERWLAARLDRVPEPRELGRLAFARERLRAGDSVEAAARAAGVSRRQLARWFREHTGISPRSWVDLERLQGSLQASQRRHGDPADGYSDQAHQIRAWRRRLGVTPGAYARAAPSLLARMEAEASNAGPTFYL